MEQNYENIKHRLGACGLHCGKCFAFSEGDIHNLSRKLIEELGNFDVYAERFADMLDEPIFKKYSDFKEFLQYLSTASCKGCRAEKCKLFKGCGVRVCSEEKEVDFCFECSEFPCQNTGFDEHLHKRYIAINERMNEIGAQAYYDEIKNKSRY